MFNRIAMNADRNMRPRMRAAVPSAPSGRKIMTIGTLNRKTRIAKEAVIAAHRVNATLTARFKPSGSRSCANRAMRAYTASPSAVLTT